MKSVVILIIVHKPKPSLSELASLLQCHKILGNYHITLVCPRGLDISEYEKCVPNVKALFIHPKWHSSYRMFNRLKIVPLLYRKYSDFDYILFYELDAWVFRDELEYWVNKGYDYMGAPWFEGFTTANVNSKFVGVGNGGFSLRNVKSHLKVLNSFHYIETPFRVLKQFKRKRTFKAFLVFMMDLTIRNNTFFLFNNFRENEDYFWGRIVPPMFPWFKLPDMKTASKFSMELNARMLYELNNKQLPFGCHKWEIYDPEFWKPFIVANHNLLYERFT